MSSGIRMGMEPLMQDDTGLDSNGYTLLSVGERFPWTLPAMGCHTSLGDALTVVYRLERPSSKEVALFHKMVAYGFYAGSDFPHGVLIWNFGRGFPVETPFNPRREEILRGDEVRAFLTGEINVCRRMLLDENGTVRALGMMGLDWGLVDLLKATWSDPNLDWSDYDERYERLIARASSQTLWNKARKWSVKTHLIGGDDERNEAQPCNRCEAARVSVSRLKNALKQAEHRETELRQKTIELQSQATALGIDKVDLEARIASFAVGPLQQEVVALKSLVQEREFRILELEEEARERNGKSKSMEGAIDDLGRRIRWLENRLRASGIATS